jgi:hypothetical protein
MREWYQKDEMTLDGAFKEIAFIRMAPDDFARRFDIVFTRRQHGRREMLSYAAIELGSGTRFFLQHEHTLSDHGIWLYGDAERDAARQCEEFAAAFGIDSTDIAAL